jgi:preprotein translocase subunit YajC
MKRSLGLIPVFAVTSLWADGAAAPSAGAPGFGLSNFMPLIIIGVLFYFLLIRPQQKQAKEQQAMLNAVKKGDNVLTQGGIYGLVVAVKGKTLEIKIADNVKVLVARSAVTQVVQGDPSVETPEVVAQ